MNFDNILDTVISKPNEQVKLAKKWQEFSYLCISEFKWSPNDFLEADIPFVLDCLEGYKTFKELEKKAMDKANKRR